MKRSISLILLTAVCARALAAVTTLGGCAAKPSDPTGSTTPAQDDTPSPTGESANYTSGYVDMALTIPEGWQWESVQDKDMGTEGIRFRKTDDPALDFQLLCWRNGYGICGTDLTSEELTLAGGQMVWQHTEESDGSLWLNLYFENVPGDYVCAPTGELTKETWDGCRDEVLSILATAQFGRGAMTEQQAIDAVHYDGEYDMAYGRYSVQDGSWTVTFDKGAMGQTSDRYVVKADGAVSPADAAQKA